MDILASFTRNIKLGHTGENEAVRVAFSLVPFKEEFPGGRPALLVKPPKGGNAYPVALTVEGNTAYWTVTAADTAVAGFGQCELQWYAGDTLAKSDKFDFWVVQALEAGAEPPDAPSKRWFDAIQSQIGDLNGLTTKAKENLVAAINEAARSGGGSGGAGIIDMRVSDGYIQYSNDDGTTWENLIAVADLKGADGTPGTDGKDGAPGKDGKDGVTPTIGANGNWYLGDEDTGKPSRGPTGQDGAPGKDGSPGKDGMDGAPGKDGADGAPGKDGTDGITPTIGTNGNWYLGTEDTGKPSRGANGDPGAAGHTPEITATKSGKVTTIKADGTAIAEVSDGSDGAPGKDGSPGKDGTPGKDGAGMDVTGATAGQIAKISSVDGNGKPTAWIPVDMPSGGGAVSSVNGQTGDVKTSWYFNVTGSVASPATTQTAAQIVAAQTAGFAPICKATFSNFQNLPATLPALLISSAVCVFGGIGATGGRAFYLTVMIDALGNLTAKSSDVAELSDIPIALKNPDALNIKIGNTITSYDGSSEKTVEIPDNSYTLPVASAATLGGVKPVAKTNAMSQEVGVDANGGLYTEPSDYTLTDADKTEIADEVIADGIEAQLGDSLPTPTDAQVNTAVSSWLTAHPEATTTVQDGAVTVEKLGYGKHFYGSKPYFCNAVGSGAKVYGAIGVVVPCKAGDTIYTNFNAATSSSAKLPTILTAFPENQYGDITSITLATLPVDNDTKQYTIPADKTTAKAFYVPVNYLSIPAEDNASVESAVAWINNKIGLDGTKCAQTVPFDDLDSWYQTAQTGMFSVDESCSKLMYASLFQAVSRLVGAKVAVLGDSLTEQSACSFINSANNECWMENVLRDNTQTDDDGKTYSGSGWFALIARKYRLKWWCAGHGLQWWYSTTARPNGATAMVRKLIDGTDEFDYIVLEYGTNDVLSGSIGTASDAASETATTSCGAIKWCIEQLQARFPEASIVVILPNIRNGTNGEPPAKQQTYLDTVVPLLKKYGVRYVNMAEDSGIAKSMMYTDGIHLRWPVVTNNVTYYTNDTPAVRKYSKCLESVLLQA